MKPSKPDRKWNRIDNRRQARRRTPGHQHQLIERLESRQLLTTLDTFLTVEHVDLNVGYTGGAWTLQPRDDDNVESHAADGALLYVGSPALTTRAAGTAFDFIGVGAGQPLYRLPQSQDPNLLYLGFAGYGASPASQFDRYNPAVESKGRVTGLGRWLKVSLVDVDHYHQDGTAGTGQFSVWQSGDVAPTVFMSTYQDSISNSNGAGMDATDGIGADDSLWIVAGGHIHYNWGFTQPGRYEVTVRLSGYHGEDNLNTANAGGYSESAPVTLYFSVGSVGQLQFDASSYSVNEGAGTASINVVRTEGSDGRIFVNYATSNGTALAGADYGATSGTLVFEDQETVKTITVPIINDTDSEGDETLQLTLSSPGPSSINDYYTDEFRENDPNGLLGTTASATLSILDDDVSPTLTDIIDQQTDEDVPLTVDFVVGDTTTPADNLIVSVASSNSSLLPVSGLALTGIGTNRSLTLSPAANQSGTTTVTVSVTDSDGLTTTDTFVLTVHSVNDVPTIAAIDTVTTDEDVAVGPLSFLIGDIETAATALVVTAESSNTTLVPNANILLEGTGPDRSITMTPAGGQTGSTTITLTVTDASGLTASESFVLTVGGVNDGPTVSSIGDVTTAEDTATHAVEFTVGDEETAAADLILSASSSNPTIIPLSNIVFGGSESNRTVTVTPAPNAHGSSTITITVTDADGGTATETFVVNVTPVNDLPTISSFSDIVINEDTLITIPFTIGDAETPVDDLELTDFSSNYPVPITILGGSGADRTITLVIPENEYGEGDVTVTVRDAENATVSVTFHVTVNAVNDPPVAVDDNVFARRDSTSTLRILDNDHVVDPGQTFTLDSFTQPAHGTVVVLPNGLFRYTPAAGYSGSDDFEYTLIDNDGDTDTATVSITVGDTMVVDLVHTDIYVNYVNGEWYSSIKADLPPGESGNPTFLDSDEAILFANPSTKLELPELPESYNFLGAGVGDDVWILPEVFEVDKLWLGFSNEGTPIGSLGSAIRLDLAYFSGAGSFSLFDTGATGDARVWIDTHDGINSPTDSSLGGNSGDFFTLFQHGHSHQNWVFTEPGRYVIGFQPTALVNTTDAEGNPIQVSSTGPIAYYYIDVDALTGLPLGENPPLARDDFSSAAEDGGAVNIDVMANDSSAPDPDEALTVTEVTQGANGTVSIVAGGTAVTYTPNVNFVGTDMFTYTVTDEHGGVAIASVTVNVAPQNDAPTAADDDFVVSTNNSVRGNVLFNDSDPDGDELTAELTGGASHGTLSFLPNGTFTYQPGATFSGSDSFTYTASDQSGTLSTATVTINTSGNQNFLAILTNEHVDIGVAYEDDAFDLHVHDETNDAEFSPNEAILYVGSSALTTRSGDLSGAEFDFLGVTEGQSLYRLPQSVNPELLLLGTGAEEIEPGTFAGGQVQLRLVSVNGPGHFSMWFNTDAGPDVRAATADGITSADFAVILEGGHQDYNFAFTARGRYEVTFEAIGTVPGEASPVSGTATYYFSVDSLGQVQFDPANYSVGEGGSRTVTVQRIGGADGPLTVEYSIAGGSALSGVDFAALAGSLTFADGETEKTFSVETFADNAVEVSETIDLALSAPVGFDFVLGDASATVTIEDDDVPLSVQQVTINGGAAQRSNIETIAVQFNREVNLQELITNGTIGDAVQVVSTPSGIAIGLSSSNFQYSAALNTLTIDLTTDGFGGSRSTSLADGRFELWLDTSLIVTTGSSPANRLRDDDGLTDGIRRTGFHRLQGDYDGTAKVDQADIDLFMTHYGSVQGKNAQYDWLFDLTGPAGAADNVINALDYTYLRKRLGRQV